MMARFIFLRSPIWYCNYLVFFLCHCGEKSPCFLFHILCHKEKFYPILPIFNHLIWKIRLCLLTSEGKKGHKLFMQHMSRHHDIINNPPSYFPSFFKVLTLLVAMCVSVLWKRRSRRWWLIVAIICRHGSSLLFEILKYGSCEQLYHVAPYCWIARFTPGNGLPVARDPPHFSHLWHKNPIQHSTTQ